MKKLFVLFACVALFAACNSGTTETTCTSTEEVCDSTVLDMVVSDSATELTPVTDWNQLEATATK